jgi:hypothetical protein
VTEIRIIERRLAIEILHQAQIAQPNAIRGWVAHAGGTPSAFHLGEPPQDAALWARLWSHPQAPAEPAPGEIAADSLNLLVSLNTKGVLEMRCWRLADGAPSEVILKIRE